MNTHTTHNNATWYFLPLVLVALVVIADQVTKILVLQNIPPLYESQEGIKKIIGDFLWFINVSNRGAVFSFGANFENISRAIILFILPIILIIFMLGIVVYSSFDKSLRWIAASICGGGIGNMLDRIIRPDGVVDFISVNVYGIFGMDRWPTFNIADSAIVVSMVLWIVMIPIQYYTEKKQRRNKYER